MRQYCRKHWKSCTLIGILLFTGCSWGMLEYTHYPGFCSTCHVMEPYYEAWKSSSHNMVGCVDCHYPPGLRYEFEGKLDAINQVVAYWTGRYNTKFYAEIEDASCMRPGCHDSRLLEGPLEYLRSIKFDHASHYGSPQRGIILRCTSCHSQIVQGNHMAVTVFTCFLCHFRNKLDGVTPQPQEFCLQCHAYPDQYVSIGDVIYDHGEYVSRGVSCQRCHLDVVVGDGFVEDRACLQCHNDPEQISKITEVEEVHLNHVTKHKVECFNCHANIEHRVPEAVGRTEVSCNVCHSETHLGPRDIYAGVGGRGVEDMPATMFLAQVDCVGCHVEEESYAEYHLTKGTTLRPSVQGCIDCHGEMGQQVFEMWQASLAAQLSDTEMEIANLQKLLGRADPALPASEEAQQLMEDAQFNYNFVKFGKGIHNFPYSLKLLEKAQQDIAAGRKLLSK
jgi:nitrate/TMAO reductase-like tetraheme cytochrome c subunit